MLAARKEKVVEELVKEVSLLLRYFKLALRGNGE